MYVLAVESLADDRFRSDLTVLNFFFDTPIITRITLEMRITVFDQISAVGGALGLFTGVSLITFAELVYWVVQFVFVGTRRRGRVTAAAGSATKVKNVTPVSQFKKDYLADYGGNYHI